MLLSGFVFLFVTGVLMALYLLLVHLPEVRATRALAERLRDVGPAGPEPEAALIKTEEQGSLPGVDRLIEQTTAGSRLARLIEQSGVNVRPGTLLVTSVLLALAGIVLVTLFVPVPAAAPAGALLGAAPLAFVLQRRSSRISRFEEQFPEALDLLSRALRAGHAFQTALGMVADEMPDPIGPEFKKTFDQQNFGLPLRESLLEMADRVPLMDVRFFVTAVTIQRETGGNLAEILDNLGSVVRERFKLLRQVRVHTAHGRFTGFVLLGLPPVLGIALAYLNPDHMNALFTEESGRLMLVAAAVMQAIGFVWIRQVIKIEV